MRRAILVDDEPFMLKGLKMLIDWETLGYTVTFTAGNGVEALEYLRRNRVDIIFSDIKMPLMNGIELCAALRGVSDAYFVIVSGYGEFEYAQSALRLGCMDYILKPVTAAELTATLRRAAAARSEFHSETPLAEEYTPAPESATPLGNCGREVVLLAELDLKKNYKDNITLKKIADKYFVNSVYLGQLFRKQLGCSFKSYLNRVRVEHAADLLVSTNKKIIEIAEEVGYNDADYFTEKFIAFKGCTPAKFRRG